jgi:hypothetical protein
MLLNTHQAPATPRKYEKNIISVRNNNRLCSHGLV